MDNIIALFTLTGMEIILGIDNIVFIVLLSSRYDPEHQIRIQRIGLAAAMIMRIVLLFFISVLVKLTFPLFTILGHEFSGRDLILLAGGLFLIAKGTYEIHHKFEEAEAEALGEDHNKDVEKPHSLRSLIIQIMLLDMVFSLDSVITAVGMSDALWVMITAVVIAVGVMMAGAKAVSAYISKHPTLKMLALSFLILIGMFLALDGFGFHVPKGYIYSAMGFSLFVEFANLRLKSVGQRIRKRISRMRLEPPDETTSMGGE